LKASLDWLRDFVTWEGTPQELADRLTQIGLNVESLEEYAIEFPGVVVGRVESCEPHADADKLSVCRVFDGEATRQVVCGAPNVRAGLNVLLALPGAVLPGGLKLKKSKIRGVASEGMICSASELELSADSEGILELEGDPEPGTPADDLYGWRDWVYDIEVTPNRPDWLSHYGIAREIAAMQDALLDTPKLWSPPPSRDDKADVAVEIEDFADCPRYSAHVARGLTVGASPRWMQNRLRAVGARPINNVVDITNYVMFELGQPLHAFDLGKFSGQTVTVKRAVAGSSFETLDGVTRELVAEDLVIADGSGPVALAGVMGGSRTEVDESTRDVMLESAFFAPGLVRRTSRALQLVSESSFRFEREADWEMVEIAARRALYFFQKHSGARIANGFSDRQNPDRRSQPQIQLRMTQVNRLLGTDLEVKTAIDYLQALGLKCTPLGHARDRGSSGAALVATVPGFRRDLKAEVDLIEEIARLYGFDRIGDRSRFRSVGAPRRHTRHVLAGKLRRYMAAVGHNEIVTSTFMAREDLDRLGLAEDDLRRRLLAVDNPRHGGETLLRTTLLPALLRAVVRNVNADNPLPLRLFQVGRSFLPARGGPVDVRHEDERDLPDEPLVFQACVAGRDGEAYGHLPAGLMEIKGLVTSLAELFALPLVLEPGGAEPCCPRNLQWEIRDRQGRCVGTAGDLARATLEAFGLAVPVAYCEIELTRLDTQRIVPTFAPFSRFPAVKRDLSLVVPEGVPYAAVERVIGASGGPLLAESALFDVFRGGTLVAGSMAIGIRLKFISAKGNLKSKAVDKAVADIVAALGGELGVTLRT